MLLSCNEAATAIHSGQIVAYPTEAIYGLGCDPRNKPALQRLLELKARDKDKGLILIASSWQQLESFVEVKDKAILDKAHSSWPGPVTWIMPASDQCSPLLTGGRSTIAVRITDHEVVRGLCELCSSALVSTSANISGQSPLCTPDDINNAFGKGIAGVVDGELGGLKNATSIFDASTGVQLR